MDTSTALLFARNLMDDYGLQDWKVEINNRFTHLLGRCRWHHKLIELGTLYVETHNLEHVKGTILHEIAHALCPDRAHGVAWKNIAIKLGCDPRATCNNMCDSFGVEKQRRKDRTVARASCLPEATMIRHLSPFIDTVNTIVDNRYQINLSQGWMFGGMESHITNVRDLTEAKGLVQTIERCDCEVCKR